VWHLLLSFTAHFCAPEFHGRSQPTLWPPLHEGLRPRLSLPTISNRAVGAYILLVCLGCDKDNAFKSLELLLFWQPLALPHCSHLLSTLPYTTALSSSSFSTTPSTIAPTSQLGKRAGPTNSDVGNNKTKKPAASPTSCTSTSAISVV